MEQAAGLDDSANGPTANALGPAVPPSGVGFFIVSNVFWGLLIVFGLFCQLCPGVGETTSPWTWIDIIRVALEPPAALLSLASAWWLRARQPEAWSRGLVSLRALCYCYSLMAYLAAYEWGRTGYLLTGTSMLLYTGFAVFALLAVVYFLLPGVRCAYGVFPDLYPRRSWWRLTWWP